MNDNDNKVSFGVTWKNATVTDCYFHLTQNVMRKANEIGMKEDYEKNDRLRLALRCLLSSAMVLSSDVTETFLILVDNMPGHEKMPELLVYSRQTTARTQ